MHPNAVFEWHDRPGMLEFVARTAFATIFVATPSEPVLVHVPLLVAAPDHLRFHVSRRNPAASADNGRAFVSCMGEHGYISPDWYGSADQVPTWNYVVVECEGPLRRLTEEELIDVLDGLSAVQESVLAPKQPWTRAKMSEGRFEAMLKAITGFELKIESIRGTRKLGQNKSRSEIEGAAAALERSGQQHLARLMRAESE